MYFPKHLLDDLLSFIQMGYGGTMTRYKPRPPIQLTVAKGMVGGDVLWVRTEEIEGESYELCCTSKDRLNTIAGDWQAMLMIAAQQEDDDAAGEEGGPLDSSAL